MEGWLWLHLVAAAIWLGGLIALALAVVVAFRTLPRELARTYVRTAGRVFAVASALAWLLIAISGVALARQHLGSLGDLAGSGFGRTLSAKTVLALGVVAAAAAHTLTGRMTASRTAIVASRLLSVAVAAGTLGVFWLAVRLAEG